VHVDRKWKFVNRGAPVDPRDKPEDDGVEPGEPAKRGCDGIFFHDVISGHRHSGAAERNPESSTQVLVQLSDSVRSRSYRIGCISSFSVDALDSGFRSAAPE
jgi:hypothetical protein